MYTQSDWKRGRSFSREKDREPVALYFAYGSNMSLDGMCMRCPYSVPEDTATLHDWRLVFRGVADIEVAEGEAVTGSVWKISADCLRALDRYEGYPHFYTRRVLDVILSDGSTAEAITYIMQPSPRDRISCPSDGYYGVIVAGYNDWELDMRPLIRAKNEAFDRVRGRTLVECGKKRLVPEDAPAKTGKSDRLLQAVQTFMQWNANDTTTWYADDAEEFLPNEPKMWELSDGEIICDDCLYLVSDSYGANGADPIPPWEGAHLQCCVCDVIVEGEEDDAFDGLLHCRCTSARPTAPRLSSPATWRLPMDRRSPSC